jgi:hypothetical protein
MKRLLFPLGIALAASSVVAQHNPGQNCFTCHSNFRIAGTVFTDSTGSTAQPGVPVTLTKPDGSTLVLDNSNAHGNIASPIVADGTYLITLGPVTSRTWHVIPGQGSCNTCHIVGGNGSTTRTKRFSPYHTRILSDNDCTHCHHFPTSMAFSQLMTSSVLHTASLPPAPPSSQVEIGGQVYPFDPSQYNITSVRPEVFAPGFFSMFDVILAVANRHGIAVDYSYDSTRKCHFIASINNVPGNYWYHWSYDAGSGNSQEIQYRRANRWDEALWRPGVWIKVVEGENLNEIKAEYLEEINRETTSGHMIPSVRIAINPTQYQGNPPGSGRITVSRQFSNVAITAHNVRSVGYSSPYSKPFQPGVVTSLDIPLSLMDQGQLNLVTGVFYTHFASHYIESYYVVALGFPSVGTAHSSGRQGIVYVTENGTFNQLPNNADNKLHMTSDINVIHAPDFTYWRWIELGNPYYEPLDPTAVDPTIEEDYQSVGRGFNLHAPYPNPFNGTAKITYNIFEPGAVAITVYNTLGQKVATLFDGRAENIGIHEVAWDPRDAPSGAYYIVMTHEKQLQVRRLTYLR